LLESNEDSGTVKSSGADLFEQADYQSHWAADSLSRLTRAAELQFSHAKL
jgi:hypothetical protein